MPASSCLKQFNQLLAEYRKLLVPESSSSQTATQPTRIRFPKLNKPQQEAWKLLSKKSRRTLALAWGRGCGKSWFLRQLCWILVAEHDGRFRDRAGDEPLKGVRIIWLMPTLVQFKKVHQAAILNELFGKWAALGAKVDRTTWTITFPGGSTIVPFPAAEANSKGARGMRADVIIADECDDIELGVYDAVAVPWLSEPWSLGLSVLGGTPRRGRHGLLWRMFSMGAKGEAARAQATGDTASKFFRVHATYRDVPEIVSPEAVADAKATTLPETFAREWEANFDAGEGLVYPFQPDFHVRSAPTLNLFNEFIVGVDWGWTDPACMLLVGVRGHGQDAEAWVLDELYETQLPDHQLEAKAKSWNFAQQFFCDPSQPARIRSLQGVVAATKAENDVKGGIARVASMMFRRRREGTTNDFARLYVAPGCKNLIRELGLYRRKRDPQNPDGFLETPEDKNNHACDALRYALVGRFGMGLSARHVTAGR